MDNVWIIHIAWIMHGQCMDNTYCMDNAWTMYGYVLVGNKMVVITLVIFLWATGWMIILTGDGIGCAPGFGYAW